MNDTLHTKWKQHPRLRGYDVSTRGQIRSRATGRILARQPNCRTGYLQVVLRNHGKRETCHVHTLVLETFRGPRPKGQEARHRDRVKANCQLSNLRWGTRSQNARDRVRHGTALMGETHHWSRLTKRGVLKIRRLWKRGRTQRAIAKAVGISNPTVSRVLTGKIWKSV